MKTSSDIFLIIRESAADCATATPEHKVPNKIKIENLLMFDVFS
jgi:hypothetical protein